MKVIFKNGCELDYLTADRAEAEGTKIILKTAEGEIVAELESDEVAHCATIV